MRFFNWIDNSHIYETHRCGWMLVKDVFLNYFHEPLGIDCYSWADRALKVDKIIRRPWCGFIHNVIQYPEEYPIKYSDKILSLEELVKQDWFHCSLEKCLGIWTLSKHTRDFLASKIDVSVENLFHPIVSWGPKWKPNSTRKVVMLGQWMRKFHSLSKISCDMKKIIVRVPNHDSDYEEMKLYQGNERINWMTRLSNLQYDKMLEESIVFLDLYDLAACNVILECIMVGTPLVIRKLPAAIEYLGEDYPLYYNDLHEAGKKISDWDLLLEGNIYLQKMDKTFLSKNSFIESIMHSSIYHKMANNRFLI